MPGFKWISSGKSDGDKKGGGVGWFIKEEVVHSIELIEEYKGHLCTVKVTVDDFIWMWSVTYWWQGSIKNSRSLNDSLSNRITVVHKKAETSGIKHLLVGDFNAHIAPTNEGYHAKDSNGDVLLDMVISENLAIRNDISNNPENQTWSRENKHSIIDYVITGKEDRNWLKSVRIDQMEKYDIDSDHNVIELILDTKDHQNERIFGNKIGSCNNRKRKQKSWRWFKRKKIDWDTYRANIVESMETWCDRYDSEENFTNAELNAIVEDWTNRIRNCINRSKGGKLIFMNKKEGNHKKQPRQYKVAQDDITREIKNAMISRKLSRKRFRAEIKVGKKKSTLHQLKIEKRKAEKKVKKLKKERLKRERDLFMENISDPVEGMKAFWKYWRNLKDKDEKPQQGLKDINGEIKHGDEAGKILTDHMRKLNEMPTESNNKCNLEKERIDQINMEHGYTNIPDQQEEIEKPLSDFMENKIKAEEILLDINELKTGKSAGEDGIWNEFIKHGKEALLPSLVILFNLVRRHAFIPTQWKKSRITMLFKKGDKTSIDNYRGIAVTSIVGKLFGKIMNSRLVKEVEENNILGDIQFGFRKDKRTTDAIFILTQMIEES